MTYQNKNIWIIGGTSGIGFKTALEVSKFAKNVIISGRSDLKEVDQKNIHFVRCDATKLDDLNLAVTKIKNDFEKIDILIFCAGIYEPMNLQNFNLTKSQEILDVNFVSFLNLISVLNLSQNQLKLSHLAIVSSIAGYFGMPNSLVYGASKSALSNLAESLYYELKGKIKVQLINPGFVKTRLTDKNSFKMPFLISDEEAGKIICKNLTKNKFEISFPFSFSILMRFFKILPYKTRMFFLSLTIPTKIK